jgi:signal transduction histidine kinase
MSGREARRQARQEARRQVLARAGEQDARLLPLMTVAPYAILAALAVAVLIAEHRSGGDLLVDLGLCAVTALWLLSMFTLRPQWWERPAAMGVFFTGLMVLAGVLVLRDPWFGLFTPACYFYAFGILPWPGRLPGVAAAALVSGSAQASGIPKDDATGWIAFAAVLAVNVVCMCGFAWWERDAELRGKEREAALEQVREANQRLQATLDDNAGLHRQLLARAREAGVLDERRRMAREIHDTLAQGLIGIITQLQAAEQSGDIPDRWRAHFAAATRMARESLAEARRSVDALRPEQLETAELADALAGVAERWSVLHGVAVRVTTTGTTRPMRPEAELALLRAAQEALANVARHAQAGSVALTLGYRERDVALEVRDDGCGFAAPTPAPGGGFGLKAMRERIEGLSGTLRVRSEPGSGTTVSALVPHATAEVRA